MSFVNVDHWLLDSLVFGTIILMTGGAIATLCRQPAIQIRVIQWTFIAALLVPVLRQLPLMPRVDIAVPRMPDTVTAERVIGGTADLQNPSATQPLLNTEPLTEERSADLAGAMAADAEPIANHAISGETPDRYTNSEQSSWLPSLSVAARGVYLLGLSWMVLACCRALWGRRRIMASATQAAGHVRKVLDDVAGNVRVDGQVSTRTRLLVSSQIDSPIMWGCFRPTIVVPDSMATKQRESDLRFALAHEWSHVLNADFHSHALGHIARTVLFYQPLCWWLHRRLTLCQDYLADAFAAQQSDHRADYAEFLVAVARERLSPAIPLSLGIADRKPRLFHRIKMVVASADSMRMSVGRSLSITLAVISIGSMLVLGGLRLSAQSTNKPEAANSQAQSSPPASVEELPDPITYEGRVVDGESKQGIEGVVVEVTHELSRDPVTQQWVTLRTTEHTTDAEGNYSFTLPPDEVAQPSLYIVVEAKHADYQPKGRSGYAHSMIRKNLENGDPPFFATINLHPGKAVEATIKNPDGSPAQNVQVVAYTKAPAKNPRKSFGQGAFQNLQTDDEGRLRFVTATPGDGVLWVYPKEAAVSAMRIGDKRGDLGVMQLESGTVISGQVLDARGKPVAGVAVEARQRRDGSDADEVDEFLEQNAVANLTRAAAKTDPSGRFTMPPLPTATYRVTVEARFRDPTEPPPRKRPEEAQLAHVFAPQEIALDSSKAFAPIEIRAVPHVVVRGRFFDGNGNPRASHQQNLFARVDGEFFVQRSSRPGADGWFEFKVPHGASEAKLDLMTNAHSALRWRRGPDASLQWGRQIELGTLEEDVDDIEIVRYRAPIALIKVVDADGKLVRDNFLESQYATKPANPNMGMPIGERFKGDVRFKQQADGRWASSQMLPDAEVTVTATKDGIGSGSKTFSLDEGETREVVLTLQAESQQ